MKKDCEPLLFCAIDSDAFIDCIAVLKELKTHTQSIELFSCDNEYYAVIKPNSSCADNIIARLCEYGDISPSKKTEICRLYESGVSL